VDPDSGREGSGRLTTHVGDIDATVTTARVDVFDGQQATIALMPRDCTSADQHPVAVDVALDRIVLELMRERARAERRARLAERVFHMLLATASSDTEIGGLAAGLGVDLSGGNAFVAVAATSGPPAPMLARWVQQTAAAAGTPVAGVFEQKNAVLALVLDVEGNEPARRLAHALGEDLPGRDRLGDCHLAFSCAHNGVAGARRALAECQKALHVLRVTTQSGGPVGFGELGIWTVLASAEPRHLADFRDATLGALLEYDARRSAQLLDTLRALVRADFQWRRAAGALGVHPNTVRYRMSVITKLTGLDLSSYRDQVKADVALRSGELLSCS
jgi:sugar diacid utilization regulator